MSLAFLLESLDEVQYGIRESSEVENLMTSVERVISYTALEAEPGYSTQNYPRVMTTEWKHSHQRFVLEVH